MTRCKGCGRPAVRLVFLTYATPTGPDEEIGPYGRDCARKVREGLRDLGIDYTSRHARA